MIQDWRSFTNGQRWRIVLLAAVVIWCAVFGLVVMPLGLILVAVSIGGAFTTGTIWGTQAETQHLRAEIERMRRDRVQRAMGLGQ